MHQMSEMVSSMQRQLQTAAEADADHDHASALAALAAAATMLDEMVQLQRLRLDKWEAYQNA